MYQYFVSETHYSVVEFLFYYSQSSAVKLIGNEIEELIQIESTYFGIALTKSQES